MHEGVVIKGDDDLLKHATDFYKNLFGKEGGNAFEMDHSMWESAPKVTNEDNWSLT